ncbi:F-actin-uncapping protein LRRC16A-like isoform X2 [Alosa sapidissima]|uniref:F-actin-uncapping protein LRRC16A-like isoform X2 n=1 Tax=Alosa sapidissima TaxID=34773 RepID=UPI001C08ABBF|nr:F-actin-uncapping protein LRRC16A-like isoform X2 [Alosa sapidissima]
MTEEISDVPKELLESIKDAVGRKIKLSVKKRVKLEIKGDKVENRVLALASHRAYILTARIPSKVEQTFNYLEIQGITCNKPTQLAIEYERGQVSLKLASTEEVNELVAHIGSCLQRICPGLSPLKVMKKLVMEPADRVTNLQNLWDNQNLPEPGPCGGFSQQYRCVCDWLSLPYREEVQWDVDTIYLTQDTRELNLQDFSHLENRDLVAIIAVLEYNQWFTKLATKDYKLNPSPPPPSSSSGIRSVLTTLGLPASTLCNGTSPRSADVCEQILRVVARSSRLEELVLDNAGLKTDFAQKLANALAQNSNSGLQTLNLANNPLEDRGIASLGAQFAKLRKGLTHLNFSKTSLSPKGVNSLAQSLSANQSIPSTLTHLDLSGNILRGDDLTNFYNFLGQPNSLATLDLSNTDCSLDLVCSALLRGSVQHLSVLNMSKGIFPHRKGKDIPPAFKHFFSSAMVLSSVNVSGTKLPPEALKALLLGLASNSNVKEVSLDLSCCELGHCLRSGGSQILEGCIAEIPNISSLDISDNGLDSDMATLLVWLAKNRSIRHLSLGKNFNNIKSKNLAAVLDNLVHMIQEEESPLTSLSLADSKLKTDLTIVLNALGSNTSLTRVDISGNGMGDMGAKMLAKALQINSKLRTIIWDRNNISPQGLQDVAAALEKNFTIRFMPIPIIDASQALKASPEKTEDALLKIEHYLYRNHETRKYLQEQAYRLQQGIVTTTTQQMIDQICVKVQDHLNSLRNSAETDTVMEDIKTAENLMKDARNSKTLLPNLYQLGAISREELNGSSVGPIQEKLDSMAGEVARVMDEQLQSLLESMVDAAEGLCPHVMRKANLRQDLMKASMGKMVVPRSFVKNTLLEQSGIDIINKISEVKLSLASFLSDRVVDEILEALSGSQHTLAEHLSRKGQALTRQGSLDLDVPEERVSKRGTMELMEGERLDDLETCMMTPKSKRKSIHSRMLRPVSRAFEMEFDLDKALEEVPVHVDDHHQAAPSKLEKKPPGSMGELPSEEAKKLQHFTKLRPRRNKKTHSSKVPQIATAPPQEGEQNGLMGRVDEGVDEFFSRKVSKMDNKRPSLRSSDSQDGEKKKKGGFLNLIKSRSSRSDKSHAASSPAPAPAPAPAAATTSGPSASSSTPASAPASTPLILEEPSSPKVRSPAPETRGRPPAAERSSSSDRSEELKTPDSIDSLDSEGSPQSGRRYGVQVMGCGLLAEMKAKQEKRAFGSPKMPDSGSSLERPETPVAVKGQSLSTESRSASGVKSDGAVNLEKPALAEAKPDKPERPEKPDPSSKPRAPSTSQTPPSPKPPPQGTKPALAARPAIPQKPRPGCKSTDEAPDSPGASAPPKGPGLPHSLKRVPSLKEGTTLASRRSPQDAELPAEGSASSLGQDPERPATAPRVRPLRRTSSATAEEDTLQKAGRTSHTWPVKQGSTSTSDPPLSSSPGPGRLAARENGTKSKDRSPAADRDKDKDKSKGEDGGNKDFVFI